MTATLEDLDVSALPDADSVKLCECRSDDGIGGLQPCPRQASWLYTMKCCGSQTFVCEQHHKMHIAKPTDKWRCNKCFTLAMKHISEIIGRMIRL